MQLNRAWQDGAGKRQVHRLRLAGLVSGGQTGADRAALDFAIEHGIPHGGWCPQGRLAEDGRIPERYQLRETSDSGYAQRTERNVQDSDGTAIFTVSSFLGGGSKATAEFAARLGKPWVHLSAQGDADTASERLVAFLRQHRIRVLNVAGPRASDEPAVGEFVRAALRGAICGS